MTTPDDWLAGWLDEDQRHLFPIAIAMYIGDQPARKVLIDHRLRLPSAVETTRRVKAPREFWEKAQPTIFVSCHPRHLGSAEQSVGQVASR